MRMSIWLIRKQPIRGTPDIGLLGLGIGTKAGMTEHGGGEGR